MIAILPYRKVFEDIFLREPVMPADYLNPKLSADVRNAVKNYDNNKVREIASLTFDTWKDLMDKMDTREGVAELPTPFLMKEIK